MSGPDNLREEIHGILKELGRVKAEQPDAQFLEEFRESGYYFVHAVKCWTKSRYPGFGCGAVPADRIAVGEPLLQACVKTHLSRELEELKPEKVCALGELAYCAISAIYSNLDEDARPTQGRNFEHHKYGLKWPLLYTCFPSGSRVSGQALRDFTLRHLAEFLRSS